MMPSPPKRIAIIDLGTNSVRLDIHEHLSKEKTKLIFREKWMVRLGQNVFITGQLYPDAMQRTILVFEEFAKIFSRENVTLVKAYATSALREAKNRKSFINEIKRKTGIAVRILSAKQEAVLIAKAITKREKMPPYAMLIDIGGGSTEISVCHEKKVLSSKSLPLGAARLQQVFLQQIPPVEGSIPSMRKYIQRLLAKQFDRPKQQPSLFIGSSGTVKGAYKILQKKKKNQEFSVNELTRLNFEMSLMTKGELLKIPAMEAKRTDLILAGSLLLEECLRYFKINKVRYTNTALRDGILDSVLSKTPLAKPLPAKDAKVLAQDLQKVEPTYPFKMYLRLGEGILRFLAGDQKLPSFWQKCFLKTCLVYRLGENISLFNVAKHSMYRVQHLGFGVFTEEETPYFELLCKWHEKEEIEKSDLKSENLKKLPDQFFRTLALLQMHYAFIKGMNGNEFHVVSAKRISGITNLEIQAQSNAALLLLQIEQHKKLYEKIFKTMLMVKITDSSSFAA